MAKRQAGAMRATSVLGRKVNGLYLWPKRRRFGDPSEMLMRRIGETRGPLCARSHIEVPFVAVRPWPTQTLAPERLGGDERVVCLT